MTDHDDHEAEMLHAAAVQMRGTELDRSESGGDFTLEGLEDDHSWYAVAFGARWNGWATPIVTRQTLQNMIDDLAALDGQPFGEIQTDGALLVYGEEPEDNFTVSPNDNDEYALHVLGWTFMS